MLPLEQIAQQALPAAGFGTEQYMAFSRACRKTIGDEVRSGRYPYLCSNTRRHKPLPVEARVNIIGRPAKVERTGERSLYVGGSEVVFVVQTPLNDRYDYRAGFAVSGRNGWLRIVAGSAFTGDGIMEKTGVDLFNIISAGILARRDEVSELLSSGNYACFVRLALCITDEAVRQLARAGGFLQYNY